MLRIYKASAGSGKTYNLTRQYITYLLADKGEDGRYRLRKKSRSHHQHILAITFTNKATNEMTQRIIYQLSILAGMPPDDTLAEMKLTREQAYLTTRKSPYYDWFMSPDTGLQCTEQELREASREALVNLLYDYSYFNVSTIDSFFQSVLRMFTREVELPDNYNIELNNNYAISIGIDEMFRSLNYYTIPGSPEDVQRQWTQNWLLDFMRYNISSGNTFNMFSRSSALYENIVRELGNISDDEFKQRLSRLKPYFAEPGKIVKFTTAIKKILSAAHADVTAKAVRLYDMMPEQGRNKNFYNALLKLKNGEKLKSDASVTNVVEDGERAFTKGSVKKYSISDECVELCESVASSYVAMKNKEAELRPLIQQVYLFGLLSSITNNIDAYCRDNSLILLSETNNIIKDLINDDETPFLYEKLGFYLNHFLIDEFQDTSPMQWTNLKPLVMESISRGKDNLIIGDEKQCIYRFRNSDPRLLGEQVETDVNGRFVNHNPVEITGNTITENSNWRSAPEIIRFNNTLFTTLAHVVDIEAGNHPGVISASSTYANVVQRIDPKRKAGPGYVKLYLENKESIAPDAPDSNTRALTFMTAEIRRQLAAGYKPGDIAILVRDNRRGQLIIKHLLSMMNDPHEPLPRFDILSDDAITLNASQSVRLIISILRLVSIPEFLEVDTKAASRTDTTGGNSSLSKHQSDAYRRARLTNRFQFYRHLIHDDGRPYTASEALEAALVDNRSDAITTPADNRQEQLMKSLLDMECLNLPGVVERIIHRFVPEEFKKSDNLFLSTFQDSVIEFSMHGNHDIRSFLKWWDSAGHKLGVTTPSNSNALTIMTIHKSKGLEFPCVHIPFANGSMFKDGDTAWVDINPEPLINLGIDSDIIPPALPVKVTSEMKNSTICGKVCSEIIAQTMVDELNVNYVAMTRATSELIVYSPLSCGTNFNSMLSTAIMELGSQALDSYSSSPETQEWLVSLDETFEDNVVTFGAPTTPRDKATDEAPAGSTLELERYTTGSDVLHARACTEPDAIDPFDPDNQRHMGRFMHSVMSRVRTPGDLDLAMRKQAYRYRLNAGETARQRARLERAVNNPQAAKWFGGFDKVITERTVTSRGEDRRPDRMVWFPDGSVDIVDYKFVDTLPAELAVNPTHKKYVRQVSRYMNDVKACTGTTVRGYLWYIGYNNNLIVEIEP